MRFAVWINKWRPIENVLIVLCALTYVYPLLLHFRRYSIVKFPNPSTNQLNRCKHFNLIFIPHFIEYTLCFLSFSIIILANWTQQREANLKLKQKKVDPKQKEANKQKITRVQQRKEKRTDTNRASEEAEGSYNGQSPSTQTSARQLPKCEKQTTSKQQTQNHP